MTKSLILRRKFAYMSFMALSTVAIATPTWAAEPHAQSAVSESLQAPKKKSYLSEVGDRLASLDIKADVKLLDTDLIDGLKTAINYRYEVEPSYDGEYHLRMDRGTLSLGVNVGEILNRASDNVGLNLEHGTEFLYVRQFKSKSDALKATPYGFTKVPTSKRDILARLPLNAQNIIDNLNVGDFFAFTAQMNIVVNAGSLPLSVATQGFVGTHYLLSGQFQIHLYKADNDKVRMKLIAVRKDEKSLNFIAGFGKDHKIFGLKVLDRRIEKVMNLTEVFSLSLQKMKSNLLMVDYMLDLKDARVRSAYDGMIASVLEFKTFKMLNPKSSNDDLTNKLISDVTPFENLYASEYSKPSTQRAVDRFFKGKNDVDVADRTKFKFAPIVFKLTKETEYFENMLTSSNPDESLNYYRMHTFQRTSEANFWFSYYKTVSVSRASVLFDSDEKQGYGKVRDIVFEWNYRDKALTADELRMIKGAVAQALPAPIVNRVNWGPFVRETEYANARFIYKMVLTPRALYTLQAMGSGQIYGLLENYIQTIPAPTADPGMTQRDSDINGSRKLTVVEKYQDSMLNIAHYLAKVVDPKLTNEDRAKAFAELRFNSLFIEMGPGFLVSLLPLNQLDQLVNFEISLTADNVPAMNFSFGTIQDRKVYEVASYIQSVLTANEFETITQMMKTNK